MKDTVPVCPSLDTFTEALVTRVNPKSASMALGGSESEIRMFSWEHHGFHRRIFCNVKTLTALMSPCATLQLWRYQTPLITPTNYIPRCEVNSCLALGDIQAYQAQPINIGMFLQILCNVSMAHPGCDDRRDVIMVKHAVELEDVWA